MKTTHHASCHCGAVAVVADIDLAAGTSRCNCTFCRKVRNWSVRADPATFRVTKGGDRIGIYTVSGEEVNAHAFCAQCGTRLYSKGHIPEMGGDFVSLSVAALDDATVAELVTAPVQWCDGLHDNWWNAPDEVRHL